MQYTIAYIALICAICGSNWSMPAGNSDIFPGFVDNTYLNTPNKDIDLVKRRVYEENSDASLKQISLQSLIGGVEDSLFQSAISASSAISNKDVGALPQIIPNEDNLADREIGKRNTDEQHVGSANAANSASATSVPQPEGKAVVLQTAQQIPEKEGVPAHVLIDRISVQPHVGGVPLIPAFEVHHTKVISATIKEAGASGTGHDSATQIKITRTDIKATGSEPPKVAIATDKPAAAAADSSTSAGTIATSTATITTEIPIVQLKQQEEKLKEKVAEVEAEPVILSARV